MIKWPKPQTSLAHLEVGTVAPLVVVIALMLIAVLSFAVDQGIACGTKMAQENALDAARDACMQASFALPAKSANNPGKQVAFTIASSLRQNGYEGEVSVWFYEIPEDQLPPWKRLWGIAIQVYDLSPTVFARGFGITSLPVASKRVIVAEPYADALAWRPANRRGCGRYDLASNAAAVHLSFQAIEEEGAYPEELKQRWIDYMHESGESLKRTGAG